MISLEEPSEETWESLRHFIAGEQADALRSDVPTRARCASSHLTEEEFRQLAELMTDRQLRGEWSSDRRSNSA